MLVSISYFIFVTSLLSSSDLMTNNFHLFYVTLDFSPNPKTWAVHLLYRRIFFLVFSITVFSFDKDNCWHIGRLENDRNRYEIIRRVNIINENLTMNNCDVKTTNSNWVSEKECWHYQTSSGMNFMRWSTIYKLHRQSINAKEHLNVSSRSIIKMKLIQTIFFGVFLTDLVRFKFEQLIIF